MDIDLNSDLGEGCGLDADLMPLLTSANICCGFHAGDAGTAAQALELAQRYDVRAGAHPGYADREHFGRRELNLDEKQIADLCLQQIDALDQLSASPLAYLKPHGALYNQACREDRFARPIVRAAQHYNLPILALPGSRLELASTGKIPFIAEGFADRRYLADGSLVPRSRPDAMIGDPEEAVRQAESLIRERGIRSLCVHGDNPKALEFVRSLREELLRRGFTLRAFA